MHVEKIENIPSEASTSTQETRREKVRWIQSDLRESSLDYDLDSLSFATTNIMMGLQERLDASNRKASTKLKFSEPDSSLATNRGKQVLKIAMPPMRAASWVLDKVGEGIDKGITTYCRLDPYTQEECTQLARVATAGVNFIREQTPVDRVAKSYTTFRDETFPTFMENEVPREEASRFVSNAANVALFALPLKPILPKNGLKALKSTVSATKYEHHKLFAEIIDRSSQTLKTFQETLPSTVKPTGFPEHLNQFYKNYEIQAFKRTADDSKRTLVKGELLYRPLENHSAFFLVENEVTSVAAHKRGFLITTAPHVWSLQRWSYVTENIFKVAREKGFETVYLGWNPAKIPLPEILVEHGYTEMVKSVSTLSKGILEKPFSVLEVTVP